MKISKSVQRRTVIFAALAAFFALVQVAHLAVQIFNSNKEYSVNIIGELDTHYNYLDGDYATDTIVIERDAEGEPLVESLPTSLMFFSKNPEYVRPDHFGWRANNVIVYAFLAIFIVIVLLVAWILFGAIQGFRTGNIFRHNHPALLRWLALVVFLYYILVNNRSLFIQIATKDLYGAQSPVAVFGSASFGPEAFIVPLLLLIFAELMAVAARINEEESMTI
ncbi:MAG: DUF2975 domain-containing protein [Rikenellaceae bacterium]|nr:DUF2975 domain-containing protein [Rikenellaceae bacterium]MBR6759733.1 DUF2975 domain-containing protein [Alistipes sp.]